MQSIRQSRITPLAIALLALLIYLPAFWWGAPHATAPDRKQGWGVDDETPLGPLAEIHNIIEPKPDRNLGYPLMYSFMASAAYAPYLGYLKATGQFGQVSGEYPFGLRDPVSALKILTYIAHLLTVLLGVGVVVMAYAGGKVVWDRRTGILAALFALVSFPMFYYVRSGNVDVPMLFFASLALVMYAIIMKEGENTRRTIWLGAFIGFALATKEPSFALFVPMPFVLLYLRWKSAAAGQRLASWWFWRPAVLTGVVAFIALGIGSGLFVEPSRYFAHIKFTTGRMEQYLEGNAYYGNLHPYTWAGTLAIALEVCGFVVDCMTLPGALLGLAGVILLAVNRDFRGIAFAVLPLAVYLIVLLVSIRAMTLRYVMPVALMLSFPAAYAAARAWHSRLPAVKYASAVVTVFAIGLSLLRGIDLTHAMLNDSRYAAGEWLAESAGPGTRIEYFGSTQKLPPLPGGVVAERAAPYQGAVHQARTDSVVVRQIATGWSDRQPQYIVVIPDHSSAPGAQHSHTCPPDIYRGLNDGSLGYHLVAFFQTPPLLPWVRRPNLDYPSVNPPIRIFAPRNDPHRTIEVSTGGA